jgi:hypothetical protein
MGIFDDLYCHMHVIAGSKGQFVNDADSEKGDVFCG